MTKILNRPGKGLYYHEIDITLKNTKERVTLGVYARNRLDASNYLILHEIWGTQHSVEYKNVNLLH